MSNLNKIRPVGAGLLNAESHDEAESLFAILRTRLKILYCLQLKLEHNLERGFNNKINRIHLPSRMHSHPSLCTVFRLLNTTNSWLFLAYILTYQLKSSKCLLFDAPYKDRRHNKNRKVHKMASYGTSSFLSHKIPLKQLNQTYIQHILHAHPIAFILTRWLSPCNGSLPWEDNSFSAIQEIPRILRNQRFVTAFTTAHHLHQS
jgi:hypothetical protein